MLKGVEKIKMAQDLNIDELVETFKNRKISCKDLQKKADRRFDLAREARKDGFNTTADMDELAGQKLRSIHRQVCKLK